MMNENSQSVEKQLLQNRPDKAVIVINAWLLLSLLLLGTTIAEENFSEGEKSSVNSKQDDNGFWIHSLRSEYQRGETQISVLLPTSFDPNKEYRTLYVLPVEAGTSSKWGTPLTEINKEKLQDRYNLICVYPTFSDLPWYCDHPSDKTIRQESYFLKEVIPFIERTYPVQKTQRGRFLLGFSKSGWGAFSLKFRHPELFARVAAWDSPLMKDKPNQFGMGAIFGTQENFEQYQITRLLKKHQSNTQTEFVLLGYDAFQSHVEQLHQTMVKQSIKHGYQNSVKHKHHWNSGWLTGAVELLMKSNNEE